MRGSSRVYSKNVYNDRDRIISKTHCCLVYSLSTADSSKNETALCPIYDCGFVFSCITRRFFFLFANGELSSGGKMKANEKERSYFVEANRSHASIIILRSTLIFPLTRILATWFLDLSRKWLRVSAGEFVALVCKGLISAFLRLFMHCMHNNQI